MRYLTLLLLSGLTLSQAAQDDMEALSALLDSATHQATQERLNVDYTPSVISVIEHKRMEVMGLKTLFDALSILPGVETVVNQVGVKKVIVRGFDNPNNFTFDKIKLIIDGVPIETALFGNTNYYWDLPTDLIDRIEVLRGPASALFGTGGFNGVINVITRHKQTDGNAIFASGGSYGYFLAGSRVQYRLDDETRLYLDVYAQRNDKKLLLPRSEFSYGKLFDVASMQPFSGSTEIYSNEQLNDHGVGVRFTHAGFEAQFRLKDRTSGNFYGWNEHPELLDTHRNKEQYLYAQVGYGLDVATRTHLGTIVAYSRYTTHLDAQDYASDSAIPGFKIPYSFNLKETEESFRSETLLQSHYFDAHRIEAGIMLQRQQLNASQINDNITPYGARDLIEPELKRDITALYLRDTVDFSKQIALLLAARIDHYGSENMTYPSYQAGMLYTPDDAMQFKLNFGHAFRVPSWIEAHTVSHGPNDGVRPGNKDLKPETTDTFEAIAIFHRADIHHLQFNVYHSTIHNVIDVVDNTLDGYANWPNRSSMGAETSYDFQPYTGSHLHLNVSYNDTSYTTTGKQIKQKMPTATPWMLKGYYLHYFTPAFSGALLGKYFSQRPRIQEYDQDHTVNEDLKGYTTVDATLAYNGAGPMQIRFSVKNLFDEDVRYPSYFSRHPYGLPREGRNFLVEAAYTF